MERSTTARRPPKRPQLRPDLDGSSYGVATHRSPQAKATAKIPSATLSPPCPDRTRPQRVSGRPHGAYRPQHAQGREVESAVLRLRMRKPGPCLLLLHPTRSTVLLPRHITRTGPAEGPQTPQTRAAWTSMKTTSSTTTGSSHESGRHSACRARGCGRRICRRSATGEHNEARLATLATLPAGQRSGIRQALGLWISESQSQGFGHSQPSFLASTPTSSNGTARTSKLWESVPATLVGLLECCIRTRSCSAGIRSATTCSSRIRGINPKSARMAKPGTVGDSVVPGTRPSAACSYVVVCAIRTTVSR